MSICVEVLTISVFQVQAKNKNVNQYGDSVSVIGKTTEERGESPCPLSTLDQNITFYTCCDTLRALTIYKYIALLTPQPTPTHT